MEEKVKKKDNTEKLEVTLFTAYALSRADKEKISQKIEKLIGREIVLNEIIDKSILAGFRLKLEDWVYDASINGQLEKLKSELYANI